MKEGAGPIGLAPLCISSSRNLRSWPEVHAFGGRMLQVRDYLAYGVNVARI